ncbi:hypothetical protein [Syntrophomonas wolfei]|uniref:hypothetical protein n=1 Tax=Syntrophomonas wolfei TaxID=863 RepID=UPI000A9E7D47|nr:hypothetical protein [Syntrophomonas wolfei]
MLVILGRYYRVVGKETRILILYLLLFTITCLSSLIFDPLGVVQTIKVFWPCVILPLILLKMRPNETNINLLLKIPLTLGVIFSLQSIALFIVIFFDLPLEPHYIFLEKLQNMPELSYGILGYANAYQYGFDGSRILRAQSWFIEPSKFAAFLLFPVLVSFGYYLRTRRRKYLRIFLVCIIGFLITFSMAGFFGLIFAILFIILMRLFKKSINSNILIRYFVPVIVCGLFFVVAVSVLNYSNQLYENTIGSQSRIEKVLSRDPGSQKILRDASNLNITVDTIKQNPFGVGLAHTLGESKLTSPNALVYWVAAGGVAAFCILILLYLSLYYFYLSPLLTSNNSVYWSVAAAFIGMTVQGLSYGTWMDPFYMYVLAVMILCNNLWKNQKRIKID